jgi:hypothetical protein
LARYAPSSRQRLGTLQVWNAAPPSLHFTLNFTPPSVFLAADLEPRKEFTCLTVILQALKVGSWACGPAAWAWGPCSWRLRGVGLCTGASRMLAPPECCGCDPALSRPCCPRWPHHRPRAPAPTPPTPPTRPAGPCVAIPPAGAVCQVPEAHARPGRPPRDGRAPHPPGQHQRGGPVDQPSGAAEDGAARWVGGERGAGERGGGATFLTHACFVHSMLVQCC